MSAGNRKHPYRPTQGYIKNSPGFNPKPASHKFALLMSATITAGIAIGYLWGGR